MPGFGRSSRRQPCLWVLCALSIGFVMLIAPRADADEPALFSLGVMTGSAKPQLETSEPDWTADADSTYLFGVQAAYDLDELLQVQLGFSPSYSITADVAHREGRHDTRELDLSYVGANALLRYRPFGRSLVSPIIGLGGAYRHLIGGRVSDGAGCMETNTEGVCKPFEGPRGTPAKEVARAGWWSLGATAGLDLNFGWDSGSTHLTIEGRYFGPSTNLAADQSNELNDLSVYSWDIVVACSVSVL